MTETVVRIYEFAVSDTNQYIIRIFVMISKLVVA